VPCDKRENHFDKHGIALQKNSHVIDTSSYCTLILELKKCAPKTTDTELDQCHENYIQYFNMVSGMGSIFCPMYSSSGASPQKNL